MQRVQPTARHLLSTYTTTQKCLRLRDLPTSRRCPLVRQLSTKRAPPTPDKPGRTKKKPIVLFSLVAIGLSSVLYYAGQGGFAYKSKDKIFDAPRFTPFIIVHKEVVSQTSFILTLRPSNYTPNSQIEDPYKKEWESGTWSVEFKQPQLQIARSYTPLPPHELATNADLRFLIRMEKGGEVSNYLAGLPVGAKVELRGPHTGVDLTGDVKDVVFLAGGTGIAPALQVAYTLLEKKRQGEDAPKVQIVWANRRREECRGGGKLVSGGQHTSTIVTELEKLQQKHPNNLKVDYLVDEEKQLLDQKKILALTRNPSRVKYGSVHSRIDSRLLFVSGPEGFMNFVAGPKRWEGGKEIQGEIGGILGQLGLRDWKVWKL